MMLTYNDIQSYVDAGLSPEEIVAELQAETFTVENPTAWTIGSMQNAIGQELTFAVAQIIKAAAATNPLVDAAWIALSTVGLQLYTADRQAMIDQLGAGNLSQEQVQVVKELGVKVTTPFADVTQQEIEDCIEDWNLNQQWATQLNEVIQPASSDRATLVRALRDAANAMEG